MQDSPVVQCVAVLYVELKQKNNQGEFLLKCFGICTARNHEHLWFHYQAFPIT